MSGSESLPAGGSDKRDRQPEPAGERSRLELRRGTSCTVVAAVAAAVTLGAGAVFFTSTTGGQRSSASASASSLPAGPGVLSPPPLPSTGEGGSASGQPASAAAGGGASASSAPGAPTTQSSGSGEGSVSGGIQVLPTSAHPTSVPPSAPAGGAGSCKATYSVATSWAGGYQAGVTVADSGSSPLKGWAVELTLANGQSISSLWNGVNSGTSGAITVKNATYNGTIAAGGSATFGFTANGDGSAPPTSISCTGS